MRRRFAQRPTEQSREKDLSKRTPEKDAVLGVLAKQKMLPAIWFIFSRMGCDRAAQEATVGSLVSRHERGVVQMRLDALRCQHRGHTALSGYLVGLHGLHSSCVWGHLGVLNGQPDTSVVCIGVASWFKVPWVILHGLHWSCE